MKQYAGQIKADVAFLEYSCTDPTCDCHADEKVQAFANKWAVIIQILDNEGFPIAKPSTVGPFDTEQEAQEALKKSEIEAREILKEMGCDVEKHERKRPVQKPFNVRR